MLDGLGGNAAAPEGTLLPPRQLKSKRKVKVKGRHANADTRGCGRKSLQGALCEPLELTLRQPGKAKNQPNPGQRVAMNP